MTDKKVVSTKQSLDTKFETRPDGTVIKTIATTTVEHYEDGSTSTETSYRIISDKATSKQNDSLPQTPVEIEPYKNKHKGPSPEAVTEKDLTKHQTVKTSRFSCLFPICRAKKQMNGVITTQTSPTKETNGAMKTQANAVKETKDGMKTQVSAVKETNDAMKTQANAVEETKDGMKTQANAVNETNDGKTNPTVEKKFSTPKLKEEFTPSTDFAVQALTAYNKYRRNHNVAPLVLNNELCDLAQTWANALVEKDDNTNGNAMVSFDSLAQDMDVKIDYFCSPITNGGNVVDGWYSQVKKHDFELDSQRDTGDFARIVWKSTKELGIAKAVCKQGESFVVVYHKPGVVRGRYLENIQRPRE